MTHVTCRVIAKNQGRVRNPTLNTRVWATFTFFTSKAREGRKDRREGQGRGREARVGNLLTRRRKGEGREQKGEDGYPRKPINQTLPMV